MQRAAQLCLHRGEVVVVARLLERALTHDVGAQRGVADVARVVDALGQRVDHVEVLREGLPSPVDTGLHGGTRDVFGALEAADGEVLFGTATRRDREAAVAHDDRAHPVPRRAGAQRVPAHLCVHMGVPVDEARRDDVTLGVDLVSAALTDASDGSDGVTDDTHVGPVCRCTRTVDHRAVADYQVVRHRAPLVWS